MTWWDNEQPTSYSLVKATGDANVATYNVFLDKDSDDSDSSTSSEEMKVVKKIGKSPRHIYTTTEKHSDDSDDSTDSEEMKVVKKIGKSPRHIYTDMEKMKQSIATHINLLQRAKEIKKETELLRVKKEFAELEYKYELLKLSTEIQEPIEKMDATGFQLLDKEISTRTLFYDVTRNTKSLQSYMTPTKRIFIITDLTSKQEVTIVFKK
jgi:hypothetical protein